MEKSQTEKLYDILKDGQPHRTDELLEKVYGGDHLGLARVGARVWDVKNKYGVEIKGCKDKDNPALYWYQMTVKEPETDIDRLFKSVKIQMSNDYVAMRDAYGKYLKAKTENDKERLANEVKIYYEKLTSL